MWKELRNSVDDEAFHRHETFGQIRTGESMRGHSPLIDFIIGRRASIDINGGGV